MTEESIQQLPPFCGNARIDAGETCDEGSDNSDKPNAFCRPDCTVGRCGDGIIDTPLELCDDGNMRDGDGCSMQCQKEKVSSVATQTLPATVIELPFQRPGDPPLPPIVSRGVNQGSVTQTNSPVPPRTTDTGPAALAVMAAGAAAGFSWMRRKKN